MAHGDKEVGPTNEPGWRLLYEQALKRAEDAEARADELKCAEVAARGEARLYKSRFEAARRKRQEADEETKRVRRVAKGALFLQSEVARLTRLLREAGVDPRRRSTIMSLRMEVERLGIAILTGIFSQQAEYGNRSVACLLHERVKPLCKYWLIPARACGQGLTSCRAITPCCFLLA